MLYPETYKIFEEFNESTDSVDLDLASNGTDCILNGDIPDNYVGSLRGNFGLHVDEEILMFRDTSFWDSKDQGTVVSDWGITIIPDNDKSDDMIQMTWENIHHVERRGDQLIFFHGENRNDNSPVHLSFFVKDEDDFSDAGDALANLFTQMAESQEKISIDDVYNSALAQSKELEQNGKTDEALQVMLQFRNDYDHVGLTDDIARILAFQKHEFSRALKILDEDIEGLSEEQMGIKAWLTWWKNKVIEFQELERLRQTDSTGKAADEALEHNFDYLLADHRESYFFVAQNASEETTAGSNSTKIKQESSNDFLIAESYLQEHFLERPYKDRKLIVPVTEYTSLDQKMLTAIDINRLGKINFPLGHPVANHLYVGHPLIPSKYIPFEDYELELIEDRVREYCVLAQALGATSITIQCINENNSRGNQHRTENLNGNASYGLAEAKGAINTDSKSKFLNEISRKINLHQEFSPIEKPHIPEGLVWYNQEPSWQRLAAQRMKGTLNVQDEFIESKKTQVVENSELQRISAEVEFLWVSANGSWDSSMEQMFETHENATLAIHVEFAPIETLGTNQIPQISSVDSTAKYTEEEQEYVDELKECLANDGVISESERRLLNKFRSRLGISEARALELESEFSKPTLQLTSDEQDYLTEYKEALEDGELSPLGRRLLNKLRVSMGISEERAQEIENSIK